MKRQVAHTALAVAAFGLLSSSFAAPAKADTASDIAALKARLKQLESQVAEQKKSEKQAKNTKNGAEAKSGHEAPPPVFVDLRKGLFVETEDKQYAFKIGGRLFVDGGGIAGPTGNGWNGNVSFGQARLEVEGKMKSWFYKMQYDFANTTTQLWNTNLPNANGGITVVNNNVTDRNFLWGGWRDAFVGMQDARVSHPLLAQPVYFKVGSQYESFSLEAVNSSKYRDLIERPLAADAIAPYRHLGAAFGLIGKDNWTGHFGIYSLSMQDPNARPVNTSSGLAGNNYVYNYPAVGAYGKGAGTMAWYQPYGGGAYWEATGRITWAPVFDDHRLLHVGVAGSFHQNNNSTAYSDDRNSAPGNRLGSEANVLGTNFLGTTDLSCGRFAQPNGAGTGVQTYNAAGNCINNIEKLGLEAAASWHNLFIQGEYMMANYNRNPYQAVQYAASQGATGTTLAGPYGVAPFISPANSRYIMQGGYVMGEWWITGEEKVQSYDQTDKNGASFAQLKIKDKFSDGGWGAWGLVGRWSVLNMNNGPYQGAVMPNMLQLATLNQSGAAISSATQAYMTSAQNLIANSGIYGGYQQNVTGGINWYPDNGIAFQFNATHVMALKSPLNWNAQATYESGYHPTMLELRTKVYF